MSTEIQTKPEVKLIIAYQKLVEIITTLDPNKRGRKIRESFDRLRTDVEMLSDATCLIDKLSDNLLMSVYILTDLLTVELASTTLVSEAIKEIGEPESGQ